MFAQPIHCLSHLPFPVSQGITREAAADLLQAALQPLEQGLAAEVQQRADGLAAAAARSDAVAAEANRRACELERQLAAAAAEAQRRAEALGAELAAVQAQQGAAAAANGEALAGLKAQVGVVASWRVLGMPPALIRHAHALKPGPACLPSAALPHCRWVRCRMHTTRCTAPWPPSTRQAGLMGCCCMLAVLARVAVWLLCKWLRL